MALERLVIGGLYEAWNFKILSNSIITRYDLREGGFTTICYLNKVIKR